MCKCMCEMVNCSGLSQPLFLWWMYLHVSGCRQLDLQVWCHRGGHLDPLSVKLRAIKTPCRRERGHSICAAPSREKKSGGELLQAAGRCVVRRTGGEEPGLPLTQRDGGAGGRAALKSNFSSSGRRNAIAARWSDESGHLASNTDWGNSECRVRKSNCSGS